MLLIERYEVETSSLKGIGKVCKGSELKWADMDAAGTDFPDGNLDLSSSRTVADEVEFTFES